METLLVGQEVKSLKPPPTPVAPGYDESASRLL